MRTCVIRWPIVFLCVCCSICVCRSILIVLIKTVCCSIPHWISLATNHLPEATLFSLVETLKSLFLQFLSLIGSGQPHLMLPLPTSSCFCSCHPQMEAVGSSATTILGHSITTQCRNPKDNSKLEQLPWKL